MFFVYILIYIFLLYLGYPRIDLLVNNVGVFFHPPQVTVDGFDVTFQSNYLGN